MWALMETYLLHFELGEGLDHLDDVIGSDQVEHSSHVLQDVVVQTWVLDVEGSKDFKGFTDLIEFHSPAKLLVVLSELSQERVVESEVVSDLLVVEGVQDLEEVSGHTESDMILEQSQVVFLLVVDVRLWNGH